MAELLLGEVRLQMTQVQNELRRVRRSLEDMSQDATTNLEKVDTAVGSVTKQVLTFAASFATLHAAVRGLGSVIRILGDFEQSMAGVRAVTRATTDEMDTMSRVARQLGATTAFSAAQAAGGMEFLGRAGFKTREIIAAMPAVLDLAAVEQIELARAADIASNVMSGFGVAAADFVAVADVLALTSAAANTSIEQLGDAMQFVAPVAASLNIPIEETAAAIGILSNAGIQASTAGTGLRRILSELSAPSSQARQALLALGISMRDVQPDLNTLTDIIDRLAEANLGATAAFRIFGDIGAPVALTLKNQSNAFRELTDEARNADGTLQQMAEIMRDTLPGAIQAFGSAVKELILDLGDSGLGGALRGIIDLGTTFLRGINSWREATREFVSNASTLFGAFDQTLEQQITFLQGRIDNIMRAIDQAGTATESQLNMLDRLDQQLRQLQQQSETQQAQRLQRMIEELPVLQFPPEMFAQPPPEIATAEEAAAAVLQHRLELARDFPELAKIAMESAEEQAQAIIRSIDAEIRAEEKRAAEIRRLRGRTLQDIERDIAALQQIMAQARLPGEIDRIAAALTALETERLTLKLGDTFTEAMQQARELEITMTAAFEGMGDLPRKFAEEDLRFFLDAYDAAMREFEQDTREAVRANERLLQEQARAWEQLGDDIQRTMSDSFRQILDGNFNLMDAILDQFKQLLADMAAAATRPIILKFVGQAGNLLGLPGIPPGIFQGGLSRPPGVQGPPLPGGGFFTGGSVPGAGGIFGTPLFGPSSTGQIGPPLPGGGFFTGQVTLGQLLGPLFGGLGGGLALNQLLGPLGLPGAASGGIAGAGGGALLGALLPSALLAPLLGPLAPLAPLFGGLLGGGLGSLFGGLFGGRKKPPFFGLQEISPARVDFDEFLGLQIEQSFAEVFRTFEHRRIGEDAARQLTIQIGDTMTQLFQGVLGAAGQLPASTQELLVRPLNQLADRFADSIEGIQFEGKDLEAQIQQFLSEDLPAEFEAIFGDLLENIQRAAPLFQQFTQAIDALSQVMEALAEQQIRVRQSLEAQLLDVEVSLLSPAGQFEVLRQRLRQQRGDLLRGGPQARIELIPQIQETIAEILRLAGREDVLGQDFGALMQLQDEMTRILRELISVSDQAFIALQGEVQGQIDLAEVQVNLLEAMLTSNQSIETLLQDSVRVLTQIGQFLERALVGQFQMGGIVPRTGLALVHGGEVISPAVSVPITIQAGGGQAWDTQALARVVQVEIERQARYGRSSLVTRR